MARWIGAVCWLLLVNTALAQRVPPVKEPQVLPPDLQLLPTDSDGNFLIPNVPPGFDPSLPPPPMPPEFDPTLQPPPLPPGYFPGQPVTMPVPSAPVAAPLVTRVYGVADLVVGHTAADPNQALLAMMAQENEELAMQLASATAGAAGAQQNTALSELAETIESTFADEFEERGSITLHHTTKSLIVRQTEEMHAEISDLLTQLRHVNDTQIHVAIQLADLGEERMQFALAHNGQVLDEATLQEFREIAQGEGSEIMTFSISARNGESASLPAFIPGTLTAVVSEDHSEVRVVLDMPFGVQMGLPSQNTFRIPSGETLLTVFMIEDSGIVMVLTAEVESPEEQFIRPGHDPDALRHEQPDGEQPVSVAPNRKEWQSCVIPLRNVSAENVYDAICQHLGTQGASTPEKECVIVADPVSNNISINASPRYFHEIVALAEQLDVAGTQIMTEVMLVEAESLPEDLFGWATAELDGEILSDPHSQEPVAICLDPATADQFIEALRAENFELKVHSRPQMISVDGQLSQVQVGQVVPVVNGVTFNNNSTIPTVEESLFWKRISLASRMAENDCIEMQLEWEHREPVAESVVQASSNEPATPPAIAVSRTTTTVTVPDGATFVWPVRLAGEANAERTMLVILTAREVPEASAE